MVKPVNNNKHNEKEKDKEYLSKKRAEPDTKRQEIDMVKFKKKINEIMYTISNESNKSSNDLDIQYESLRKNYFLNEFTSNCLKYINKIILFVKKNHLKKFQGIFELNKIFITIIKELLMNEFELILLSLYLESVDISSCEDIISFRDSLIYLCFLIKKLTLSQERLTPINSFLNRKYQSFDDKFNKWFESNSAVFNNKLYFSYMEINQRFKEYNQSHSIYCKNNYIDYNLIIDRILTMSIPYNDAKNDNLFENRNNEGNNNNIGVILNSLSTSYNNLSTGNKNNININQNYLYNNNNNLNNYLNNYISTYPTQLYLNQNNNNNNKLNSLYNNKNNFLCQINTPNNTNNEQLNIKNINKDLEFPIINRQEIAKKNNNNTENEPNKKGSNNKMFLVTQEQKNIDIKEKENEIVNNKIEKGITPNDLLSSLGNDNSYAQNNKVDSNKKKDNNNDNNVILNNDNMNLYKNNLIGLNAPQQMNEYNQLKYNTNYGINDINSSSQLSLLSLENPYFMDVNNFYNNIFQASGEENLRQIMNQSNENFFKSCLSVNGIYSSKNFFPNINNNNYININENNNNINYLHINQLIPGNPIQINPNNNIQNNENLANNIKVEKNNKDDNNYIEKNEKL